MAADPEPCTSAGNPVERAKSEPSEKWCSIFSIPVTQSIDEDAEIKDEDDGIKPEEYRDEKFKVEHDDEHDETEAMNRLGENPLATKKEKAKRRGSDKERSRGREVNLLR